MTSYNMNGDQIFKVGGFADGVYTPSAWVQNPYQADFSDEIFYSGKVQVINDLELTPIHVHGNCMEQFFNGSWPGISYSQVPYTMKAFQDQNGRVYRPGANHTGYLVEVANVPTRAIKQPKFR